MNNKQYEEHFLKIGASFTHGDTPRPFLPSGLKRIFDPALFSDPCSMRSLQNRDPRSKSKKTFVQDQLFGDIIFDLKI